jgi:hypothetical protein
MNHLGILSRTYRRLVGVVLAAVAALGLVVAVPSASMASVWLSGGFGGIHVSCDANAQLITYDVTMQAQNGYSGQRVAFRIWTFDHYRQSWNNSGWIARDAYAGNLVNSGFDTFHRDGLISQYSVYVEYAWLTTAGWVYRNEWATSYQTWTGYLSSPQSKCFA